MRKSLIISFLFLSVLLNAQDQPCSATVLTPTLICSKTPGTSVGAAYQSNATNGGTPSCATPGAPDVWYSFVATAVTSTITSAAGTMTNGAMSLYSSSNNLCSGTLTEIDCNNNGGPGSMPQINANCLVVGDRYFIRFWSASGGTGTFSICVLAPDPATPSGNQDCGNNTAICSNTTVTGNSSGGGNVNDLNSCNEGCLNGEHQSSWYYFQMQTAGVVGLTITTAVDYDFAIWQVNNCPISVPPVRCSYAAGGGNTGLGNGATDVSEGSGGNRWVSTMTVTAGQNFIMMIDNYTSNSTAFTLNWGLSGGSSFNCAVLPIELNDFTGIYDKQKNKNILAWKTISESNNDHFELEYALNAVDYIHVTDIPGAGTSNAMKVYTYEDIFRPHGAYYRLKQVDRDLSEKIYGPIFIDNSPKAGVNIVRVTDILGREANLNTTGIIFIYYENGDIVKQINN